MESTKEWKGSKLDLLLFFLYVLIYITLIHTVTTLRQSFKKSIPLSEALLNPGSFFLTFVLLLVFLSPFGIYFRKIPKKVILDEAKRQLEIHKKRKKLVYNIDKIRFCQRNFKFFYVLEIHATFESSQKKLFERLASTIIVPIKGLSWNKSKVLEIVSELKRLDVQEIESSTNASFSDYLYK